MIYYLLGSMVLFHLYLYWKLRLCFGRGTWNGLYWTLTLPFLLVPAALRFGLWRGTRLAEVFFALSITEFVLIGMASAVLVCLELLKLCVSLWDRAARTKVEARFTPCRLVVGGLAIVLVGAAYFFFEAWNVGETRITLETDKLPRGVERLRIVHLTDVHLGGLYGTGRFRRVMEIVRQAQPDLFVVTGDLVDGNMEFRTEESRLLSDHGARYGAFAVTGNHEAYYGLDQAVAFMEGAGLSVLRDRVAESGGIVVAGLDDPAVYEEGERWPAMLELASQDRFVLLLKHRPGILEESRGRFDLQLSGHTHGGQLWPFDYSMRRVYGHRPGLAKHGSAAVYVSNGAGFWGAPFRFLAPPEVTVIDLVPAAVSSAVPELKK